MKILSIGSEINLFKKGSGARQRIAEYGSLVAEYHAVEFSLSNLGLPTHKIQIVENVWGYPTNSISKWNYISDAIKIGRQIPKPDLISAQDPFECGYVGYKLANYFGCKLHLQVHTDFLSPHFKKGSFLNKVRVRLAKFLIPQADCIRVVSERIKKSLIENCKLKIENSAIAVLPIFVDVQKIKAAPVKTDLHVKYHKFRYIILMASRLTKEKNIGMAIEALSEIAGGYAATALIIVGEGALRKRLTKKAKRLGLQNNVIFEDWTDDLASYYKSSDLFLLSSNYEGYGRTVIEAMAAGCPVLMTNVGLAGEFAKNGFNALVVPVKDKEKFKEALQLMVVSPERAKDLLFPASQTIKDLPTKEEYLKKYKESWEACL